MGGFPERPDAPTMSEGEGTLAAEGVTFIGPAILAAGSYRFEGRQHLDGQRPDDIIWDIDESRESATGAVIVEDCHVINCTFRHMGRAVTPGNKAEFLTGLIVS